MSGQLKNDSAYYEGGSLDSLNSALVNSWVRQLTPESSESATRARNLSNLSDATDDNRNKRRVFHGHYVIVKPTGLRQPRLILYSPDVAENLLQLKPEQIESEDFLKLVSGNLTLQESWATPYALSIMGERYTNNCPFGTGDGYGDGRAVSIGEMQNSNTHKAYELQLKGAGKTPFHRGADGRAVVRSSVREFLASEAMHWLGVPTTRALSLIVSGTETVQRPWYTDSVNLKIPDMEDPRLERFPPAQRKAMIRSMRNQKADPNVLVSESCAITCRVSPSFVRIGHLDLFARRATSVVRKPSDNDAAAPNSTVPYDTDSSQWKELEDLIWHACCREFREEAYDPYFEERDILSAANKFLELVADKIAFMIGNWIRVGFAQGNFNADNCLVGGYTMDYGPFGFIEEYSPLFSKWVGSGQHYGFLNQPIAGLANYNVLVMSIAPVIAANISTGQTEEAIVDVWMKRAKTIYQQATAETFRVKCGLDKDNEVGDKLWEELEPLLRGSRVDWTLFWRQLTYVMREYSDLDSKDYSDMLTLVEAADDSNESDDWPRFSPFYEKYSDTLRLMWVEWIQMWREALKASAGAGETGLYLFERMKLVNPKFVLREWMLVDGYKAAAKGNYAVAKGLHELVQKPYEEGTEEQSKKYYRRTPDKLQMSGGTAFMS